MTIKNLTPHVLNVYTTNKVIDIPPDGVVPRCRQFEESVFWTDGIQITRQTYGEVENLPEKEDGVLLVVSRLVAAACPDRKDLLIPGPLVRNEQGQPVGCKGLSIL